MKFPLYVDPVFSAWLVMTLDAAAWWLAYKELLNEDSVGSA